MKMLPTNSNSAGTSTKWLHPNEVLKLQRLKLKKKKLQARINNSANSSQSNNSILLDSSTTTFESAKRKNPFIKNFENKRPKPSTPECEESSDHTLFKLLHLNDENNAVNTSQPTSFINLFPYLQEPAEVECQVVNVGKTWIPIDWALKQKVRLMSPKPFIWNQKLKISEEASGITGFVRCLDNNSETTLDTSPNAKFHQCCLYWQHPVFPWLSLFPRTMGRVSMGTSIASAPAIRESLQRAWSDSLRSLFQLVRTCQCPYFYMCTNTFTVLFRAAGISGYTEMNALITPTTSGFRQLLKQEDIEFSMPLKPQQIFNNGDNGNAEEDEVPDERWLQSMGLDAEDIKQINYTQARIAHKTECEVDNSEESLVLVEGMEVHALYNFLMNSKSVTSTTGPLAGIPPTLLAPIAFHGATLSSLKIRESKVRVEDSNYFSLEISGPILPHLIHNLCLLHPSDHSFTATFANCTSTLPLSKVRAPGQADKENKNSTVFGQENLSDCGLNPTILKHFCSSNLEHVANIDCLKFNAETATYTWS